MSTLTLNDGTVISVLGTSTTSAITVQGELATVSAAIGKISTENLKNATLGSTEITNKVYTGFTGSREENTYTVTFSLRDKTEMEIVQANLVDLNAAVGEIGELLGGM